MYLNKYFNFIPGCFDTSRRSGRFYCKGIPDFHFRETVIYSRAVKDKIRKENRAKRKHRIKTQDVTWCDIPER